MSSLQRIEIDGLTATADQLGYPAMSSYGHFTAMQVRGRRTRGLSLHLSRLDASTRELFGAGLDGDRVRQLVRHALGDDIEDASVRAYVFEPDAEPSIMVTVKPPAEVSPIPQRLQSVRYQRPVAHVKHLGGFGQEHYGRLARRNGFDEALLAGSDEVVSEGATTNIGFFDGSAVVWPDAPALHGITMQLLELKLAEGSAPSRRATVRLGDVASFDAAFVCNARGIAPVSRIDDVRLPVDAAQMRMLTAAYESVPWDKI